MVTEDAPSSGSLLDVAWIVEAFRVFFNSLGIMPVPWKTLTD
jgi:hypothetical protein